MVTEKDPWLKIVLRHKNSLPGESKETKTLTNLIKTRKMEKKEVIILLIGIIFGILLVGAFYNLVYKFSKKEKSTEIEVRDLKIMEIKWEESSDGFLFISYYPPIPEYKKPQWIKDLDRAVAEINQKRKNL